MLTSILKFPLSVRLAATLWLILLVGVTTRVSLAKPTSGSVVPIYQFAGLRWLAETDLYAPTTGLDVYRNPPGFAALFSLMSDWPTKVVALSWRTLGLGLFILGLYRAHRALFPHWTLRQQGWVYCLAVWLVIPAYNNGQVNLLMAASLLHAIADLARGRYWAAAAWFSLGTWLKVYPIAVALLACILYPRALVWRLVVMLGLAFTLPVLMTTPDYLLEQYRSFLNHLQTDNRNLGVLTRAPQNWTILLRTWLDLPVPRPVDRVVAVLSGLLMAMLIGLRRRDESAALLLQVLVLGSVWMTAFGPATEANTYSLMAGAAALAVMARPGWLTGVGYGLLTITVLRGLFPNDWKFQVLGPQPLGAICISLGVIGSAAAIKTSSIVLSGRLRIVGGRRTLAPIQNQERVPATTGQ